MESLTITGSSLASSISFDKVHEDAVWILDQILLNCSLGNLTFPGDITSLEAGENTIGILPDITLGQVGEVQMPKYYLFDFEADGLGSAQTEDLSFNVAGLRNLTVHGDIRNVTFLSEGTYNYYRNITVDGAIDDCTFYGYLLDNLLVRNQKEVIDPENPDDPPDIVIEDIAVNQSNFFLNELWGMLRNVTVREGDVTESTFSVGRYLNSFRIDNGNLEQSTLTAPGSYANLGTIIVDREIEWQEQSGGHVIDSTINVNGSIRTFYAAGSFSENSQINASGGLSSRIYAITTGGDFEGTINTSWIHQIKIGFDSAGKRLVEDQDFSGADFSGSVYATLGLYELNVTGAIQDALIYSNVGSVYNIYAEDGFTDSTVSVYRFVSRIVVGYFGGARNLYNVANYQADISLTVFATLLGSLTYTGDYLGELDEDFDVLYLGSIRDDFASLEIQDVAINGTLPETWSLDNIPIDETDSGVTTVKLSLGLTQFTYLPVTVDYVTVAGTAAEDVDYNAAAGTVTFYPGQTVKTIQIDVINDDVYEGDETFSVRLSNPQNTTLLDNEATVTIMNNDMAPTVSIKNISLPEGDSGNTTFSFEASLELSNPTGLPVNLTYETTDQTAALADTDYQETSGVLTFEPGGLLTQTIEVLVFGDTDAESDETFLLDLTITNATPLVLQATGTIEDDD